MVEGQDNLSELLSEVEDSLEDLGYTAVTDLKKAADDGLESQQLTDLVCFLAQEVGELAGLEDRLQETEVGSEAWIMELSSLLRELGCPHTSLTQVTTLGKVLAGYHVSLAGNRVGEAGLQAVQVGAAGVPHHRADGRPHDGLHRAPSRS